MWWIIIWIAVAIIGAVLQQKSSPTPVAATMDDFHVSTATENRAIPVVFGTRWVSPNNTLYGDLMIEEVHGG